MKPKHSDIDGTVRGRAMVISVHGFETEFPATAYATFDEPDHADPERAARGFIASFARHGDDYWDEHTVILNERAKFLCWQRRMYELLGEDGSMDTYLSLAGT